jgi:mannitol-1-phosphate 5-dehydrogenase
MSGAGGKCFVGFGFGPIQSGLFLAEAYRSRVFSRYVVADIDRELVAAFRAGRGVLTVNVAGPDRVERLEIPGVEVYNPQDTGDYARIRTAVAHSDEMCTALPSVAAYGAGGPGSVAGLIAAALRERDGLGGVFPTVLYTAENNNRAAEILTGHLEALAPGLAGRCRLQILNTVVGKMSGLITDPATIGNLGLAVLTPGLERAILVEEYNSILVSKVRLQGYTRGLQVFVEKEDLLPFEEAKLYGHNAIHALMAYLADWKGCYTMADAGRDPWIMARVWDAFLEETGPALCRRHARVGDALFTAGGFRGYAQDLIERMVNPHLHDLVERVGRDPLRKLALDDRLYGAMRLCLEEDIQPRRMALGAAAAILSLIERASTSPAPLPDRGQTPTEVQVRGFLHGLWGEAGRTAIAEQLLSLTQSGLRELLATGR